MMDFLSGYWSEILLAISAFSIGVISPGPAMISIISCSMSNGRQSALFMAWGVATGSLFWGIVTASGLSKLLAYYSNGLYVLKVFGGLFLLWLAFKAFQSMRQYPTSLKEIKRQPATRVKKTYYFSGLIIHLTNPKAILTWTAVISLGLTTASAGSISAVIVGCCFSISIIIHSLYAIMFSSKKMVNVYQNLKRYIDGLLCAFFAFAGIKLILTRN